MADVLVIGAGHNGLTAAAILARGGHSVRVFERRGILGGLSATEEFYPGFRVSSGLHRCPLLSQQVVEELDLLGHGLKPLDTRVGIFGPTANGGLFVPAERTAVAAELGGEASSYLRYLAFQDRLAPLVEQLRRTTPPLPGSTQLGEVWRALQLGRGFWGLDEGTRSELLRIGPMCVGDFMREWFDSELLCAMLAAPGLQWTWMGPWSAGSVATLLLQLGGSDRSLLAGGMGNLAQALAACARGAGAEVHTGCTVASIETSRGRVCGVRLETGETLAADAVLSACDPKRTFLSLVGPEHLPPGFTQLVHNGRGRGTMGKVHLALSELPRFTCRPQSGPHLAARIHVGSGLNELERAFDGVKYGRLPQRPMIEALIPSYSDPTIAPPGQHVLSVVAHHVPYDADREALGDRVLSSLAELAPNLSQAVLHREVLTPADLENRFGVTGGHPAHLEHALDQLFFMRPMAGWAAYRSPVEGLYICGMGTHPGGGISCRPGANAAREVLRDL